MATIHSAATLTTRYQTTEYNRSRRLESRLKDIYSQAVSFHFSHETLLETINRDIYQTADYSKLTGYYLGHLHATREMLSDQLYRYHLEWRVRLDGKLVLSKDVPEGAWPRVTMGEHVWSSKPECLFSSSKD